MRAGPLRHRLIVERPTLARDAAGDELVTWTQAATVWARIEPFGGQERGRADQILAGLDTRITIRWAQALDAIAPKWRVRHEGTASPRVYDIEAVQHHLLGQREIFLFARSGLTEG